MKCYVVRDLLPMYVDNLVSEETHEAIESHLKECPSCEKIHAELVTPIASEEVEKLKQNAEGEINFLKKIRATNRWTMIIILLVFLMIVGIYMKFFILGKPASIETASYSITRLEQGWTDEKGNAYAYPNGWVMVVGTESGKSLTVRTRDDLRKNEEGKLKCYGTIYEFYEVESLPFFEARNSIGFVLGGAPAQIPGREADNILLRFGNNEVSFEKNADGSYGDPVPIDNSVS